MARPDFAAQLGGISGRTCRSRAEALSGRYRREPLPLQPDGFRCPEPWRPRRAMPLADARPAAVPGVSGRQTSVTAGTVLDRHPDAAAALVQPRRYLVINRIRRLVSALASCSGHLGLAPLRDGVDDAASSCVGPMVRPGARPALRHGRASTRAMSVEWRKSARGGRQRDSKKVILAGALEVRSRGSARDQACGHPRPLRPRSLSPASPTAGDRAAGHHGPDRWLACRYRGL